MMMPFCGPWPMFWIFPVIGLGFMILVILFVIRPVALGFSRALSGSAGDAASDNPAEILRRRYAHGEITREQYREALTDVLKDRYVRGEITLEEFEARLERLLASETPGAGEDTGRSARGEPE